MRLVLDTCSFLWIVSGSGHLSSRARTLFTDPQNDVFLSAVSAWEIAFKWSLGKLPLPESPATLIPRERSRHGVSVLALGEDSTLAVARLPNMHRDPFDRILVCQAIIEGLTILTPDPLVAQYPVAVAW